MTIEELRRWRVKNAIVEAIQWNPGDLEQAGRAAGWLLASGVEFHHPDGMGETTTLAIRTPGGGANVAQPGDWIVRGVTGTFFAVPDGKFGETYEPASISGDATPRAGIDAGNDQFVGGRGEHVIVQVSKPMMTRAEALRHAAWLVLVADPSGEEFARVLDAVRST